MPDVLIKNGTVVDGSGQKRFQADVAITGERIEAVGSLNGARAKVEIDASGRVVCPGVIDVHSHADLSIYRADHPTLLEPLVRQGVTTFIGGNCGMSLAPLGQKHPRQAKDYMEVFTAFDGDEAIKWNTMGEFLDTVESRGCMLNWASLTGHGLLRIEAMGPEGRASTKEELQEMSVMLEESLEGGSIGMSTGLQYFPGLKSETTELVALGKILKKYDAIFTSHLRSYSNTLPQAIGEVIEVAEKNDIRAQVSHLFWVPDAGAFGPLFHDITAIMGKVAKSVELPIKLDGEMAKQINRMARQRKKGVEIRADVMPTTTGFTHMLAFFPPWALQGGADEIKKRLADKDERKKILHSIENGKMTWPHLEDDHWSLNLFKVMGWQSVWIMAVQSEKNRPFEGRRLVDIAADQKKHPLDAACDLLLEENGQVLIFESITTPDDAFTERSSFAALKDPETPISTDSILMGFGHPSYLFAGCYPKFFSRYVREKKMLTLETAVRKCSGVPADHYKLKDRGYVRKGHFADILIFDPDTISTTCTFDHPIGRPYGIDHVFINGHHIVEKEAFNLSKLPGKVLRRH